MSYENTPEGLTALRATLANWPEGEPHLLCASFRDDAEPDDYKSFYRKLQEPLAATLEDHGGEIVSGHGFTDMTLHGPAAAFLALIEDPAILVTLKGFEDYYELKYPI